MAKDKDVILITGGNGFVGQHIIKLLHQHCQNEIKEIRVFDIRPFEQRLNYEPTIPMKSIKGDIRVMSEFSQAVSGADCVLHVAGFISVGTYPEAKRMKEINVDGTNIVMESCLMNNVRRLVQTSSVDAVSPLKDCVDVDESNLPYPPASTLAMPEYATTKQQAEKVILGGHGRPLANGKSTLQTVSVRPTGMYGEEDVTFYPMILKRAAKRGGVAITIAPKDGKQSVHDVSYVGNVAWAHICAMRALRDNPDTCSGKAYFITDDTPRVPFFEHQKPILQCRGFRQAKYQIPFRLAYYILFFLQITLMFVKPFLSKPINLPVNTKILDYINYDYIFKRNKAENDIGYKPIFSYEESLKHSVEYYKVMDLTK